MRRIDARSIPAIIFTIAIPALFSMGCSQAAPQATAASAAKAAAIEREAIVDAIEGAVTLEREGVERALAIGDRLLQGDVISLAKGATCEVSLQGLASVRAKGLGVLSFDGLDLANMGASLGLRSGSLACKVAALDRRDSFSVRTPCAVMGVRGTAFEAVVGPGGEATCAVAEGAVTVYPLAIVDAGLYAPGTPPSIDLDAFPRVSSGEETTVTKGSFRAVDDLLAGKKEGLAAALPAAAKRIEAAIKPIGPAAAEAIRALPPVPDVAPLSALPAKAAPLAAAPKVTSSAPATTAAIAPIPSVGSKAAPPLAAVQAPVAAASATSLKPPTTAIAPPQIRPTTIAPTAIAPTKIAPPPITPTKATPTTIAPTTIAPTTIAPTKIAPTTIAPTTVAPTTIAPTTVTPTNVAPTTIAPTTIAPTTIAPTTIAPTTIAPTTITPTTIAPTTIVPRISP